jgi:hypothetical protein
MATGRLPDPNTAPVTAKGDLYTYSTTPARLAVGNNGETLVADSSASTGLRWNPSQVAGRNAAINGGFDFWQRGTSFSTGGNYTADRWLWSLPGTGVGSVTQQTFTPGAAPVAGYEAQYFARLGVTTVGSSSYSQFNTRIEDVRTFAGQTVTISFWAKVNSGSVSSPYVRLNQVFGSGGSTQVTGSSNAYTPTGSWARYSATLTLPSISGKTIGTGSFLEIEFITPFSAVHTIDFWGIQLELGSVATTWSRSGGTLAGELAACQRYYYRITPAGTYRDFANSYNTSTTTATAVIPFPFEMRTNPTALEQSGTANQYNIIHSGGGTAARLDCSAVPSFETANKVNGRVTFTFSSGLTAGQGSVIGNGNNSTAYLGWSAEL